MKYATIIGQRIKHYRIKLRMTQKVLAKGICEESYISKIENGVIEPSTDILLQLKERLQIPGVPITEEDYIDFLQEIDEWNEDIKNRLLEPATNRYENLKWRMENSLDERLEIPFYISELRLNLIRGEMEYSRILLDKLAQNEHKLTDIEAYDYYYCKGVYCVTMGDSSGLQYFKKAVDLDNKLNINESRLYYAIGNFYTKYDQPVSAIYNCLIALEKARFKNEFAYIPFIEGILAYNYGIVGQHNYAESILKNSLSKHILSSNHLILYNIYHTFGCIYLEAQQYILAINAFETAFQYCKENSVKYLQNTLLLSSAHEQNNDYHTANKLLEKGLAISRLECYEDEIIQFESAIYAHDLTDDANLKYIENISLPYFIRKGKYRVANRYLERLIQVYTDKHSYKQALKYSRLINHYLTIILGGREVNYEEENLLCANNFNSNYLIKQHCVW